MLPAAVRAPTIVSELIGCSFRSGRCTAVEWSDFCWNLTWELYHLCSHRTGGPTEGMASGTEACLSVPFSDVQGGRRPRGLTRDKVAEVVKVGQAIRGAAQPAKVCSQALRSAHGVRRVAAGGAAFPKVEGLLAQPCTHCVLKQELHNKTSELRCMKFGQRHQKVHSALC